MSEESDFFEGAELCFSWIEAEQEDDTRIGAMYCFKSCGVNQN